MIPKFEEHASNERTFLAWVRTAIAIVGFGIATSRLGGVRAPFWSEALLLIAGAGVVLIAYLRMRRVRKRINAEEDLDDDALPTDTLLLVLVGALFVLLATFTIHVG